jgi:cation transport regulator ChaC
MNKVKIAFEVSEELVRKAEPVGLLTNERITSLLEDELEKQEAFQYLKKAVKELRTDGDKGPGLEEIQDEIKAMRAEKRKLRGDG